MKKLMSALLGISLILGAASISFAQDVPGSDTTKKNKKKKKSQKTTAPTSKR